MSRMNFKCICKKWGINSLNSICIFLLIRSKSQPDDDAIGSKHVATVYEYFIKSCVNGYLFTTYLISGWLNCLFCIRIASVTFLPIYLSW